MAPLPLEKNLLKLERVDLLEMKAIIKKVGALPGSDNTNFNM